MNLLCWNCRGLRNPRAVRDLHLLVKEKRPNLLFLMETKVRNVKMERIKVKLGYEGLLTVEPMGKSGGLALLWKNNREVLI